MTVHHAGAKHRRDEAHGAPWMRRRAADERVAPQVSVARVARCEAVVYQGQVVLFSRTPDRLEVRVVDRVVEWHVGLDAYCPGRTGPGLDLLNRRLDIAGADHD